MRNANRVLTLADRPSGFAGPEHFAEETRPIRAPDAGELLLESVYISIDPAMRVWISENPGYVQRIEIGDVMRAGGIARVVESRADGIVAGDLSGGNWAGRPIQRLQLQAWKNSIWLLARRSNGLG